MFFHFRNVIISEKNIFIVFNLQLRDYKIARASEIRFNSGFMSLRVRVGEFLFCT
jgi:hypothetical protein